MGFRINTNIAAMNAHNNATVNNRALDDSLSKLSSGLRITKAADDASGMVIANSLRSQASSLGQAMNNGNDAIGLIQTADGALDEYSKILDTIKTKSIQAASDGQNTVSRLAIQKDIDRLMENLGNIAKTTSFNGQTLLSGNFVNKEFQIGANSNESVKASIASTEPTRVGHTTRTELALVNPNGGSVSLNVKSSITGKDIQMKPIDLQFNNQQQNGMGALADEINKYSGDTGIRAKAVVEISTSQAIRGGSTGADFAINGIVIGSVIVANNDNSGSLLSSINSKTTLTGVSATMNQDGSMMLTALDGRAIKVDGDVADVFGTSNRDMTTLGHIELVQSGASEFQITNKSVGATGLNIITSDATVTNVDSTIAAGSILLAGSTLAQGSSMGGDTTIEAVLSYNEDSLLAAESSIAGGSTIKQGTTLGGTFSNADNLVLNEDMRVTAGSVLNSGTLIAAGTVITTKFTDSAGDVHNVGEVLTSQVTLGVGDALTLTSDMTLKKSSTGNTEVAAGSTLNTGSILGIDMETAATVVISKDMTLKAGSSTTDNTILKAGSTVGDTVTTVGSTTINQDMNLKAGSTLISGSTIAAGSTIGGPVTTAATPTALLSDMSVAKGSLLGTGTVFDIGTVIQEDMSIGGVSVQAGDVLKSALTSTAPITLTQDMVLLKGTVGAIGASSVLANNDGKSGTIDLGTTTNSALADIDVTTLEGAMRALDTLTTAIGDLDNIRADLGSVQNQIVSTINNISVTQVNVKAAESQIRDVDFAAESATFSKHNILAQSGSYAMSQANAVQQNVLKLLQ